MGKTLLISRNISSLLIYRVRGWTSLGSSTFILKSTLDYSVQKRALILCVHFYASSTTQLERFQGRVENLSMNEINLFLPKSAALLLSGVPMWPHIREKSFINMVTSH